MPRLSGPELVARLRRTRPALPVVYVTGYPGETSDIADVDQEPLMKPLSRDALLSRVREHLDERATLVATPAS